MRWAHSLFQTVSNTNTGTKGEIQCIRTLGDIYRKAGQFEQALAMFESMIHKANEIGDRVGMINAVVSTAHALFKDHTEKRQTFPPSVLEVRFVFVHTHALET